jgi:sialate O-acetylesterase
MKFECAILLLLVAALAVPASAAVKPYGLFTDGAVLQQGIAVPVWGSASDGEKVTVKFQNQTVSTTAMSGTWMVHLKPLKPGGPFTMKISSKENTIELKDMLVGEVWVCSGQSNMAWPLKASEGADQVIAASGDPMLRLYTVPQSDVPVKDLAASWQACGPDTSGDFSAVGYFFGRDLRKALKVPVGLINSSVSGTPAEAWTSRRALKSYPELASILETPRGRFGRPTCLYNGMIAPLIPYAIRGAIWYQGEGNAWAAYQYRTLFPAMIKDWRDNWAQGDFPFLFVQLAPFGNIAVNAWPELREAQLLTFLNVPKTGMAVITDVGEKEDIHPKKKEPVGGRLAIAARATAYGEDIVFSGPIYKSMQIEGDREILSFDHIGGGLVAKDGDLTGFTIAGEDQNFVPAQAVIQGDKVAVWSPQSPKPVAVRYGWENFPVVNLFNKEGLPATPFRTDDFPMLTGPK